MIMMKLKLANLIRKIRATKNAYLLYDVIDKTPDLTIYDLSKKIKWSPGKISYYVRQLIQDRLVKETSKIVNEKTEIAYHAIGTRLLINWDEMKTVKKEDLDPEYFNL